MLKELKTTNKYLKKYKWLLFLGLLFVVINTVFGLYAPILIRDAINILVDNLQYNLFLKQTTNNIIFKNSIIKLMFFAAIIIFITALIKGIFMYFMRQTLIVMSRKIEFDQKNELYNKYQQLNTTFYKKNNTGDLMSRISEDVSRVRMYFGPAIMYIFNLIILFSLVIYTMFSINSYLSFWVLLPLPILTFLIYKVSDIINKKSEKISVALSNLTTKAQETFSGIRVIQAYAMNNQIQTEFVAASEDYKIQNISLAKIESFFSPLMLFLIGTSTILTIYIGGLEVQKGSFTAGNIAEFVYYINMLTWPVASLGWAVSLVQRAESSQKRINEFLSNESEIINHNKITINEIETIEFKNISFVYPDTGIKALNNINFVINKGEKVAIIGKTGSGKTTIAELLLRTYDIEFGTININNIVLQDINLLEYRNKIGYTPQDVFLFSDTIKNNIFYGTNTTDNAEKYAEIACINNEIKKLPKQYETIVGERGVMLSGGQKQRISIARCLAKNPELVILDDCLSAVDAKTEKNIFNNLNTTLKDKTVVFITHRIFAVMNFDKIIVLENGEIAEMGNHTQLLQNKKTYFELYNLQQIEK